MPAAGLACSPRRAPVVGAAAPAGPGGRPAGRCATVRQEPAAPPPRERYHQSFRGRRTRARKASTPRRLIAEPSSNSADQERRGDEPSRLGVGGGTAARARLPGQCPPWPAPPLRRTQPAEDRPRGRRNRLSGWGTPGGSAMGGAARGRTQFLVEIIKPSHYDDDGYVIQWARGFIPSNSLACLYALVHSTGERRVLGEDVDVVANAYDETTTVIPVRSIIRRIRQGGGRGLVLMAGVQTNQFPRAADLARQFRAAGIAVAV